MAFTPLLNNTITSSITKSYSCAGLPLPPTLWQMLVAVAVDPAFQLRCAISGVFATLLYCVFGYFIAGKYDRKVRFRRRRSIR